MTGINVGGMAFSQVQYVPLVGTDSSQNAIYDITRSPGQDPAQRATSTANVVFGPILDPTGTKILYSHTGNLRETPVNGSPGDEVLIWDGPPGFGITGFAYSPDGTVILFTIADNSNRHQLYTIPNTGTDQSGNETVLYADPSNRQVCGASYNFNSTKIAFDVLLSSTSLGIWVCDADGTGAAQLDTMGTVSSGIQFEQPLVAWMRGSSRLAWSNRAVAPASPVWKTMLDDGSGDVTLGTLGAGDVGPTWNTWAPDDSFITRVKSSNGSIHKLMADGSGDSVITAATGHEATGSTPRVFGNRVYWESGDDIWSCMLDGSDERNETGPSLVNYELL